MGWLSEDADDHEGGVVNVLLDGRVADGGVSEGVVVDGVTAADVAAGREVRRYPGSDEVDVIVAWDQVATWRVRCVCGWTGGELPAVTDTEYGTRDCPDELADRVFRPQWQAHIAPIVALAELEQLVEQLRSIQDRVDETVRRARNGGASWAQIGRAAVLSKQGAQQRWG